MLKWECAIKYLLAMVSRATVEPEVAGKTRNADSVFIQHVRILSIEVSLLVFHFTF